jgi:hypothetical protein
VLLQHGQEGFELEARERDDARAGAQGRIEPKMWANGMMPATTSSGLKAVIGWQERWREAGHAGELRPVLEQAIKAQERVRV